MEGVKTEGRRNCEAFMMIDIVKRGLRVERTGSCTWMTLRR